MTTTLTKWISFGVVVLLFVGGGLVYWVMRLDDVKLPSDPGATEALRLIKTHPARQAPTIEQAILNLVQDMKSRGKGVWMSEWRVAEQGPDIFIVSVLIREKGSVDWIERDYAWRVNVKEKWIKVITLPAIGIMPFHELPPLPHSEQISFLRPLTLGGQGLG